MNQENTNKLFTDFPILYSRRHNPDSPISSGINCQDGWFKLIYEMSREITKADLFCTITEMRKSPWGGLMVYITPSTRLKRKPRWIRDEYIRSSYITCEICGKPGKEIRPPEHLRTFIRCEECKTNYEP